MQLSRAFSIARKCPGFITKAGASDQGPKFLVAAQTSAVTPEAIIIIVVVIVVVVVVVRPAVEGEAWIEPKAPEAVVVAKTAMAKMACEVTMAKAAVTSESTVASETVASGGRQRKRGQSARHCQGTLAAP